MKKYIAVFCGSSDMGAKKYAAAAKALGKEIAKNDYGLVYGGGNVGLMKVIADAVLEYHGHVIGVVTQEIIDQNIVHPLVDIFRENDYAARKKQMMQLADAFIILPGGLGTLDEAANVAINNQFASYKNTPDNPVKPVGIYNANGFFDGFKMQLQCMFDEKFMPHKHLDSIYFSDSIPNLVTYVTKFESPTPDATRWWEEEVAKDKTAVSDQSKQKENLALHSPFQSAITWEKKFNTIQNKFSALFSFKEQMPDVQKNLELTEVADAEIYSPKSKK